MAALVKKERGELSAEPVRALNGQAQANDKFPSVIDIGSSSSDDGSDSDSDCGGNVGASASKKRRLTASSNAGEILPVGVVDQVAPLKAVRPDAGRNIVAVGQGCKQFWKAGDYEGDRSAVWDSRGGGMDHIRVHPKFLHSNATSHKWALGAFAELLDNSLDEVCNGATFANIDMTVSKKDGSKMLLVEDNGGGMDPDKMRHCMSLGYSAKSKIANTIGQYGNGFKTSTMRLGADVIVFSRCLGKDGKSPTQSIGLLSYTFLRSTGKEDIVVPILDYELEDGEWRKMARASEFDWEKNVETIIQWSPFSTEAEVLRQFCMMKDHGTRIFIYNLWEDDEGELELDFDSDPQDIQIRGVNRDDKSIQMAAKYPNSRHFLTYRHSLRSYASILYLRLPSGFRVILRGKDVEHHNIVNDMMHSEMVKYRPQPGAEGLSKDMTMSAEVTIGFVKDAKYHIDVQGFNVYHKNRLIKPFWRLWNAAGSDGRGVIGVLEANFVEPAHDKQGFERTTALARLEARLVQMQKNYWRSKCHQIGYAPRQREKYGSDKETSPDIQPSSSNMKRNSSTRNKTPAPSSEEVRQKHQAKDSKGASSANETFKDKRSSKKSSFPYNGETSSDDDGYTPVPGKQANGSNHKAVPENSKSQAPDLTNLKWGSSEVRDRSKKTVGVNLDDVLQELEQEKEKCKSLETQLQESQQKVVELTKEQDTLIDIFAEERDRRDTEEKNLRKKLQDASNMIEELRDKIRLLERNKVSNKKI